MNELTILAGRLHTALGGIEARIEDQTGALTRELEAALARAEAAEARAEAADTRAEAAEADLRALREAAESETGALAEARDLADAAVSRAEAAETALSEASARAVAADGARAEADERAEAAQTAQAEAMARIQELENALEDAPASGGDDEALSEANGVIDALNEELAQSRAELMEARAAQDASTAQVAALSEKLNSLKNGDTLLAQQARGEAESLMADLIRCETAMAELQRVNAHLRTNNAALRGAIEAGLSDASLVDGALQAELDALRAARDADRAELDNVLAALAPVLKEAGNA